MPHAPTVIVLSLTTLSAASLGQITLLSTNRSVEANQDWLFDRQIDRNSTNQSGGWTAAVSVPHSQASQSSTIHDSGFDLHSYAMTAGGGAGHHSTAFSVLDMGFDIAAPMQWDLTFAYQGPSGPEGSSTFQFTRVDMPQNLLADVHWDDWYPEPVVLSGFLDPGRYRMYVRTIEVDMGRPTTHDITFNVSVPSPATLCPLLAAPFACRRRKR